MNFCVSRNRDAEIPGATVRVMKATTNSTPKPVAKKSRSPTSPHSTVEHLIRAVGGADHVTLVDVSATLRSLEQKAGHFRQRGLEESSRLVAGDIRVLKDMVPRLVAGHPPLAGWERGKAYQIGDLITAENGVWRLTNGDGAKRADWEPIVGAPAPATKAKTIDEEIADEIRHLEIETDLDADDIAFEKRILKRYHDACTSANLTADQLESPLKLRQHLRTEAGSVELIRDALNQRDELIEQLEKLAKDGFADFELRLVKVAELQSNTSAGLEQRLAELEAQPLQPQITSLDQRVSDATAQAANASSALEQRLATLESDERFRDLEQRLVDVAALQGSTLGGLEQRLAEVETKALEVERVDEVERRMADLELKFRVVKSVTNVVGWDDAGRITRTEKLEGQGEFIDAAGRVAELEQRLNDVLDGSLIEALEDDGRFVVRRWVKDGRILREARSQTKMPLFRGIYDHTKTYLPGDMISRGGSLWHTDVRCSGPFDANNFTLCVKRGRDGANHD